MNDEIFDSLWFLAHNTVGRGCGRGIFHPPDYRDAKPTFSKYFRAILGWFTWYRYADTNTVL